MMRRLEHRALALLLIATPAAYAQAPSAPEPDPASPAAPAAPPPSAPAPAAAAPSESPTPPVAPPAAAERTSGASASPAGTPRAGARAFGAFRRPTATGPGVAAETSAAGDADADLDAAPVAAAAIPSLSAWLGVGSLWVPSQGLDPFSEDDALVGFSAGAALSLAAAGELDVAAVAGWDTSSSDARFRGEPTSLGVMRFALGPELRGSIVDRLYYHGRLSPTLTRLSAELDESSSLATLSDTRWTWGAEAAVGLDFRFAQASASGLPAALAFFARVEAGYAWSPSVALSLDAEGPSAPVRVVPLELADLSLAGPTFEAVLGAGF
jgi:hypothetical protein